MMHTLWPAFVAAFLLAVVVAIALPRLVDHGIVCQVLGHDTRPFSNECRLCGRQPHSGEALGGIEE